MSIYQLTSFTDTIRNIQNKLHEILQSYSNQPFEQQENTTVNEILDNGKREMFLINEKLKNINEIIKMKNDISNLFEVCQNVEISVKDEKNKMIDVIIRLLKEKRNANELTNEQFLDLKREWIEMKVETPEEKAKREIEEMLEEIKEKEQRMNEIANMIHNEKQQLQEERKAFDFEKETFRQEIRNINQMSTQFVQQANFNSLIDSYNQLILQHNEIYSNYVKKSEIQSLLSISQITCISADEKVQLEEWTNKRCCGVVFDSDIDNWNENTSLLNEKIIGKKQLVFLIEDEDGEKFGYYLNNEIVEKYEERIPTDYQSFHFNLFSNGRLYQPMKFEIKNTVKGGYVLYNNSYDNLISCGNMSLYKQNNKGQSHCIQDDSNFDYKGIQKALCGKIGSWDDGNKLFTPIRIIVLQMN